MIFQRCLKSNYLFHNQKKITYSILNRTVHNLNVTNENARDRWKMLAWQVHSYGGLEEVQLSSKARIPHIDSSSKVLIKVDAASVNPLDVAMIRGYGSTMLNLLRNSSGGIEFPLTLGRDFSGEVCRKGCSVQGLREGDRVWGVVPPHLQGSHAEFALVEQNWIARHPENLSSVEASSILYAGLTAWAGLKVWVGPTGWFRNLRGQRTLVLGASGGVGNMATQMLRAEGAYVVCTCSTDAVPLVQSLGADMILDRNSSDFDLMLKQNGPYDLILDCAGQGAKYATDINCHFRNYVTFTTPMMSNGDSYGAIGGLVKSTLDMTCDKITSLTRGGTINWAYFVPSCDGIKYIQRLVESNKLRPVIDSVYSFENVPLAYERLSQGHARGKVVIDVGNTEQTSTVEAD